MHIRQSAIEFVMFQFSCVTDTMRNFIQQLRQETGVRLCEKVFDPETDKPSKVRSTVITTLIGHLYSTMNDKSKLIEDAFCMPYYILC